MIEVQRNGERRPIFVLIDGKPMLLREAARALGLPLRTLSKRIERGTPLDLPLGPYRRGNWSVQGL